MCSVSSTLPQCQSVQDDWQSVTNISLAGLMFSPVDDQTLFLQERRVRSLICCAQLCHATSMCRIFDFDGQSGRCRLFEGDIATMGSLVPSASSLSRVGSIQIGMMHFIHRGQPCSLCEHSRYLTCVTGTCQCYPHSFFDGSTCQSQKLIGAQCNTIAECRTDLNYTCLSRMKCARKYQTSHLIGDKIYSTITR